METVRATEDLDEQGARSWESRLCAQTRMALSLADTPSKKYCRIWDQGLTVRWSGFAVICNEKRGIGGSVLRIISLMRKNGPALL